MLLPLRRITCPRSSVQLLHARSLNTLPGWVSWHNKTWDPTRHSPHQTKGLEAPPDDFEAATEDVLVDAPPTVPPSPRKLERAELQRSQKSQKIEISFDRARHRAGRPSIRHLTTLLQQAAAEPTRPGLHTQLWKAYSDVKGENPRLVDRMSERAWDLLWQTQETGVLQEKYKTSRLRALVEDMRARGKYETVGRRIHYLNGLINEGLEEQALREWEEDHDGTNNLPRHDYKPEHLELGARLYALNALPDRARQVMEELLELYPSWDRSVVQLVFRAHTSTKSTWHHHLAKVMYDDLRHRMGSALTLRDYDCFFIGFLEARNIGYAKIVFRDMITALSLGNSSQSADIEGVLKRLHMLFRLGTNITSMTSVGLQAISVLPPAYHPHIYREWLRKASFSRTPDAAASVLEMMFRQGCQPSTNHFNMLLRTLIRTDEDIHVLRAEDLGWRMVEEARKHGPATVELYSASDIASSWDKAWEEFATTNENVDRVVPRANIDTFAILMRYHGAKLQWEHVDYLARQWKEHGLLPNDALMNVLMSKACRQERYSQAWKIYKNLTDVPVGTHGVFPNGMSIRTLWLSLRLALGSPVTLDDPELPAPRQLMAETVQWWKLVKRRGDVESFLAGLAGESHEALSTLVMHCFSYSQDLAGSLVGLHILRSMFKIAPSHEALGVLQRHAAVLDMYRITERGHQQQQALLQRELRRKTLEKLDRVFHILMERRFQRMGITDEMYMEMGMEERVDLFLNLLSEFVRVILKRTYGPEVVEAMITEAKEEMGVPDLFTGDLDAFNVA